MDASFTISSDKSKVKYHSFGKSLLQLSKHGKVFQKSIFIFAHKRLTYHHYGAEKDRTYPKSDFFGINLIIGVLSRQTVLTLVGTSSVAPYFCGMLHCHAQAIYLNLQIVFRNLLSTYNRRLTPFMFP